MKRPLTFVFPADPLDATQPDEDYAKEYAAAKHLFDVALIQLEALMDRQQVKLNRRLEHGSTVVYRGWMLTPAQYDRFFEGLQQQGVALLTTPAEYRCTHLLPGWANRPHTLASSWTEDLSEASLIELLAAFEGPVTVKDFVKSRKHEWHEAFYIPDAADTEQALTIIGTFINRQGEQLVGGVALREFVELLHIGTHPKSHAPIFEEYRIFYYRGNPLVIIDYWKNDTVQLSSEDRTFMEQQASGIASPFFTIDYARKSSGELIIMEMGDAQVSGLQDFDEQTFYERLATLL
mgnify:CR=1 FL=1